jgi:hypothetical protein
MVDVRSIVPAVMFARKLEVSSQYLTVIPHRAAAEPRLKRSDHDPMHPPNDARHRALRCCRGRVCATSVRCEPGVTAARPRIIVCDLKNAGIGEYFERSFSVDAVRKFKPAAEVYHLVGDGAPGRAVSAEARRRARMGRTRRHARRLCSGLRCTAGEGAVSARRYARHCRTRHAQPGGPDRQARHIPNSDSRSQFLGRVHVG